MHSKNILQKLMNLKGITERFGGEKNINEIIKIATCIYQMKHEFGKELCKKKHMPRQIQNPFFIKKMKETRCMVVALLNTRK
jgi:hypothetical protein